MKFAADRPVRIVIASQNPVKSGAIAGAFARLFPQTTSDIVRVSVDSGVPDQPMSDTETKQGAQNRVALARQCRPSADLWAGIEGGIERDDQGMSAFAWIIVESVQQRGAVRTASFPLPPRVVELIEQGVELGHANDEVFGRENSKHEEGAVGTLTGGVIDRKELYEHAAVLAFTPFKNPKLFPGSELASE